MTTFALDTNIISYILKENPRVLSRVRHVLRVGDKIVIPPLVYYEVRRGFLFKDAPVQAAAFKRFCHKVPVGRMARKILDEGARVYAALRKQGRPIEDADILIAAFCIGNGYTLVTNNIRHFEGINGLRLADWAE